MDSDSGQCLIAVIVMDLEIMEREIARKRAAIIQQKDTVDSPVRSTKYGLFIHICHKRPAPMQVSSLFFRVKQNFRSEFDRLVLFEWNHHLDKQLSVTSLIYPVHTVTLCRLFSCCQSLILASCQSQRMKNDRKRGIDEVDIQFVSPKHQSFEQFNYEKRLNSCASCILLSTFIQLLLNLHTTLS